MCQAARTTCREKKNVDLRNHCKSKTNYTTTTKYSKLCRANRLATSMMVKVDSATEKREYRNTARLYHR